MPDKRKHRGPHPCDEVRFGGGSLQRLVSGSADLSWLLSRGYAANSAVKIVGDRYDLDSRQRVAIRRCACGDDQRSRRRRAELSRGQLIGREVWIDGFNVLTTIEAALSAGPIFRARDECYRDMASMHGSYRRITETRVAIGRIGEVLEEEQTQHCRWLFDQPVSNSGRLKTMLRQIAEENDWNWSIELVADPDAILKECGQVVATADSVILDNVQQWFNLARAVIERKIASAWIVDLSNVVQR